jgi:hypothetical protein
MNQHGIMCGVFGWYGEWKYYRVRVSVCGSVIENLHFIILNPAKSV